jgi:hypothetical protein
LTVICFYLIFAKASRKSGAPQAKSGSSKRTVLTHEPHLLSGVLKFFKSGFICIKEWSVTAGCEFPVNLKLNKNELIITGI